jgi:GNAT superfamily N-acetyltransferase
VRDLFHEYPAWATEQARDLHGEFVDLDGMLDLSMSELELLSPPSGHLLLAREAGVAAGVACMERIREDTCEIKRMDVRAAFRGGRSPRDLLERFILEAKEIGYSKTSLDSASCMRKLHSLYRSAGFKDVALYPEIETDSGPHRVYMQLELLL